MTVAELQLMLRRDGGYQTPVALRPARPCRPSWLTTLRFARSTTRCVLNAARACRRNAFDEAAWSRVTYDVWAEAERMGAVITCTGFENIGAQKGPVVFVANHMSMLETFILPVVLLAHGPLSIVLKKSLLRYPVFGPVLRQSRPVAVTRKNARADLVTVLREGRARLAEGRSVLIFPQATRRTVFVPEQFNSLGDKLAAQAGVPLVPLALQTDFQGVGRIFKDLGPVNPERPIRFAIGPVLSAAEAKSERHRRCVTFIAENLCSWGLPVAREGGVI